MWGKKTPLPSIGGVLFVDIAAIWHKSEWLCLKLKDIRQTKRLFGINLS